MADSSETEIKEVDTVLATHELIDLFDSQKVEFSKVKSYEWTSDDVEMMGSPSGWGFMEVME